MTIFCKTDSVLHIMVHDTCGVFIDHKLESWWRVNLFINLQLPYILIIVPRLVKMYPLFTNPMCSTICSLECSHSRLDLQICSPDKSTTSQRGLTFKADSTLLFQLSQEQVTGSSPLQPQSSQCSGLSSLACWPLLLCLLRKQCWADACNLNLELNWWKFLRASPCGIQPCPHGHVCKELALPRCQLGPVPSVPTLSKTLHYHLSLLALPVLCKAKLQETKRPVEELTQTTATQV